MSSCSSMCWVVWWTCYSVSDAFHAVVGDWTCLGRVFEGFRWFKVAVNNTQLSQRATWKCSQRTSPFKFSFCSSVVYNALRDLGGLNLRRLRHWRDPAIALALSRSVALGAPQFDAPYVCTIFSHVPSARIFLHSSLFQLVVSGSGCYSCSELFSPFSCMFFGVKLFQVLLACCGKCYNVFQVFRLFFRMVTSYLLRVFDGLVCGCEVFLYVWLVRDEETKKHTTKNPQNDEWFFFSPGSILTIPSQ